MGYLTESLPLTEFPDYLAFFPKNAIVLKIRRMGYLPQHTEKNYVFLATTADEYIAFTKETAAAIATRLHEKAGVLAPCLSPISACSDLISANRRD